MKRACILLLKFVIFLFLFAIVAGCLNVLDNDCFSITAGVKNSFFSFVLFIQGIEIFFPFIAMLALLILFLSCIRQRNHSVWAASVVVSLSVLVFVVLIPFSLRISQSNAENPNAAKTVSLSPGYFRNTSQGTYYFTAIDKNYIASGVKLVPSTEGNRIFEPFSYRKLELNESDKTHDILIAETIIPPPLFSFSLTAVQYITKYAADSYASGWLSYLGFASIGIGLLSLWGISFFSSWPLLSALFVVNGFALIVGLNVILETAFFAPVSNAIIALSGNLASLPFFIPLVVNILLLLLFSTLGFIAWLIRYRRYAGADL